MGSSPTTGTKIAPKFRASEQFLLPDCTHTDGVWIRRHDRICGRNLVAVIQMCVDIRGRSNKMRLFLADAGYQKFLESQERGKVKPKNQRRSLAVIFIMTTGTPHIILCNRQELTV